MTYTAQSPFRSRPRITLQRFKGEMERVGSPWAARAEIYYAQIVAADHDPAVWLAIGLREHRLLTDLRAVALKLETNSWTNARSVRWPGLDYDLITTSDLRKAGITDRDGPYVRYRSVEDSLTDGIYRVEDPGYEYRRRFGPNPSIGQVLSVWTESEAIEYTAYVVGKLNEWNEGSAPVSLTGTIAGRLRDRGREVHDIRGRMVRHKDKTYDRLPNEAWIYTGVHHTAVSRGVRSLEGDIASWRGHSVYHVNTHGWPGIAYAIGVSLSGRIFMLRDVEEEGYHAFNANGNTIGICGDLTTGNRITSEFRESLVNVLEVLHAAPEFPNLRDRPGTFGHRELAFVDSRNSGTSCPGDLLSIVQEYRAGAAPDPPPADGPPKLPPTAPEPHRDQNPWGQGYWIPVPFLKHIDEHDWFVTGFAVSEAFIEGDKLVQYFERARLEWDGQHVTRGLVGWEAMVAKWPDRAA